MPTCTASNSTKSSKQRSEGLAFSRTPSSRLACRHGGWSRLSLGSASPLRGALPRKRLTEAHLPNRQPTFCGSCVVHPAMPRLYVLRSLHSNLHMLAKRRIFSMVFSRTLFARHAPVGNTHWRLEIADSRQLSRLETNRKLSSRFTLDQLTACRVQ